MIKIKEFIYKAKVYRSMAEEYNCKLIEKLFKWIFNNFHVPFDVLSIAFAFLVYFSFVGADGPSTEAYKHLTIIIQSILIAFQVWFIQNLLNSMKETFGNDLNNQIRQRFASWKYCIQYFIMFVGVIGFFAYRDYIISEVNFSFGLLWEFSMLYLMVTILWIFFNISWALDKIRNDFNNVQNILEVDKIVWLIQIKKFILNSTIYYIICITLIILASNVYFLDPIYKWKGYSQIIFIVILFLVGVRFFFNGTNKIEQISKFNIEDMYQREGQKLMDIIYESTINYKREEINNVLASLQSIEICRERIFLQGNKKSYDIGKIIEFIAVLSPPVISFLSLLKTLYVE